MRTITRKRNIMDSSNIILGKRKVKERFVNVRGGRTTPLLCVINSVNVKEYFFVLIRSYCVKI